MKRIEECKICIIIEKKTVRFLKDVWVDFCKIWKALIAALLVLISLFIILKLFGVKVDILKSLNDKLLGKFVVINSPPRVRLFTYYGTEFGLPTTSVKEFIKDGQILSSKRKQRIYVGVHNDEPRSLKEVTFNFIIPDNVKVINKNEIKNTFWFDMDKQYCYYYPRNIPSGAGIMLHPSLELEFSDETNEINYKILCKDFLPKEGRFILKVRE